MYRADDAYDAPQGDAKVWRYSNMAKFLRLLQKPALYFSITGGFNDHFEGCLTRPSLSHCVKIFMEASGLSEEQARQSINSAPGMVGINCWHLSEHESAAMWASYATKDHGIAVQSTFDRLSRAFHRYDKHVWIGKVRYIDYTKDEISKPLLTDVKQWLLHKRKEFSYEQELRAMVIGSWQPVEVYCDLKVLIESIRIAPEAPPYMVELVREVCRKFDVEVEVNCSALSDFPPQYSDYASA